MENTIIRLQRIELKNFKNIQYGEIDFLSYKQKVYYDNKAEVIGIYGQNGSGKTAVIEALKLLKNVMSGVELPQDCLNYIYQSKQEAVLNYVFYIEREDQKFLVYYEFVIAKRDRDVIHFAGIEREKLSYSEIGNKSKTDIIAYNSKQTDIPFLPKIRYKELVNSNKENEVELKVAQRIAQEKHTSYIFGTDISGIFKKDSKNNDYGFLIEIMKYYAKLNLFVITNEHSAPISLNFMPISFRMEADGHIKSVDIAVNLLGTSRVDSERYLMVSQIIDQMNYVLKTIIPNLNLEIWNLGKELSETGEELTKIELIAVRKDIKVPLRYESEGIKKIISILSTLISMFNNPSICLAVDELDAGIFEYLLGELLEIIEKSGKGQCIFTSHNLRAMEKLNKESIVVSTVNSENRFTRISYVKNNHNLRNLYLRGIDLGGLEESIYEETNSYEIAHAFRKAGESFGGK